MRTQSLPTKELARHFEAIKTVSCSARFTAILDHLLGFEERAQPAIAALSITSDGCVLARREGDCGFNDFIGEVNDLRRNILGIAKVAGLTPQEAEEVHGYCMTKIMDWRR
ncbi:MAG TPA: hypothetical protein VFF76_00375 [Holophagaceae bacterium]|nr:hypothetical protein [Holophagaceae bacterium]